MQNGLPRKTTRERRINTATTALVIVLQIQATFAVGESFAQSTAKGAHSPKGDAQSKAFLGPTPISQAEAQKAAQQKVEQLFTAMGVHVSNQIPVNFPVPPYPSNVTKTVFTNSLKPPQAATALLLTNDPTEKVFQYYWAAAIKAGFKAYVKKPKPARTKKRKADRLYAVKAVKNRQELKIFCLPDDKTRGTKVTMLWTLTH